ncbi:MAG TPA: sugar ABC transporter permease [Paludibacteraceae bacterium]|nr:sugar ABC transporter permease [Paludibacteraceae bacterium]
MDIANSVNIKHRKKYTEASVTAVLFLLPATILFLVFVVWPIVQSAHYSVYSWDGLGKPEHFIGLENYARLLKDPVFWKALGNNFFVLIWSLVTQIPLGILLAILLTGRIKGSVFFRTLYISPMVLSGVIVGLLWQWVYNPSFGLANSFLTWIGFEQYTSGWLGDAGIVMVCVMIVSTWRDLGFYIIIFIVAIQSIPEEICAAAKVDGANSWQLHRYVTLPLIKKTTLTAFVLSLIGSLQFFDLTWVMTQGGPYHSSEVVTTYMFKTAFQLRDWGYATTLAFVLFCITFFIVIVFLIFNQTRKRFK